MSAISIRRRVAAAGSSAQAIHDRGYRRWRRRTAWVGVAGALPLILIDGGIALIWPAHSAFALGSGLSGSIFIFGMTALLTPEHIDRWRRGAEGERRTGRALRALERQGWLVVHDRARGRGNFDHVAVAPSGRIFVLDSKNYGGHISLDRGRISVRWRDDPEHGWELDLGRCLRGAAAGLSDVLAAHGLERQWITPVAVIWGDWDGAPVMHGSVAYVPGPLVTERLLANAGHPRPPAYERAAAAVRALPAAD